MSKILITGGTGLVGERLTEILEESNHEVVILSRTPKAKNEYKWDISKEFIDEKVFKNLDYIVHLAGAGIADKKWTAKRKEVIINSRVDSANLLFNKVKSLNVPLKGFISASGIGFYGAITSEKIFTEKDKPANDFLGEVCVKWEQAALQFDELEIPTTILRTGVVLSKNGGALVKMKTPIISGLGSGKQYMPWIHIDDLCYMYKSAIEGNLIGIFNAVAPQHHTNKSFSRTLAKTISRPFMPINVPSFVLKLVFGELANVLLEGSRVSVKKIEKSGYSFRFKTLYSALSNL